MPFVQGRLRNEALTIAFTSECAHCAEPLHIEMDSSLACRVRESTAPLMFIPLVEFAKVKDPSIIDVF